MKCPLCNIEMRLKNEGLVENEGKIFLKQTLICRGPKTCPNYGKIVKTIYIPKSVTEDPEAKESAE